MMMMIMSLLPSPAAAFPQDDYLYFSSSPLPPGFVDVEDGGSENSSPDGGNLTQGLSVIGNESISVFNLDDLYTLNLNKTMKELLELELQEYPIRDPLYVAIPMTLIYSLILLSGLIGNISTCVVIAKNPYMHTATNYYLFSLAMSDLLLLLSGLPQEMYHIWIKHPYVFGEAFCVIRGLAAETSANATVLTITAFTVERFVAIVYPLKSHKLSQLSRVIRLIGIIWIVAFCLALPQAAQFGIKDQMSKHNPDWVLIKGAWCTIVREIFPYAFQISICVFFVIPMTIITVLYVLIGLKLRRSRGGPNRNSQELTVEPRNTSTKHSQSHVIRMLVAVVVAFFICWAPFHAQRLMAIYGTSQGAASQLFLYIYEGLTHVSGILYFVSTCINPILYHIMSNKFRQAFKDTMGQLCGRPSSRLQNRTYSAISHRSSRMGVHHGNSRREQETCVNCRHTPTMCSCRGNSNKYLRTYNLDQTGSSDTTSLSLFNSSPSDKDGVIALATLDKSQGPLCQATKPQQASGLRAMLTRKKGPNVPHNNGISSKKHPPSDSTIPTYAVVDSKGNSKTIMASPQRPRTGSSGNAVVLAAIHKTTCRAVSYTSVDSGKSNNTISNSSLQDLDESEYTGEELAGYLAELKNMDSSKRK